MSCKDGEGLVVNNSIYILINIFRKINIYYCRCDADPAALAKYVFALVKKDKPAPELKSSMIEQLDVFLQSGMYFQVNIWNVFFM